MAQKRRSVEDRMFDFKRACTDLTGPALLDAVRAALQDKSNLVVEMAATAVIELEPGDCRELLVAAWQRFLEDPIRTDKNCRAKLPIIEALNSQRYDDPDLYQEGIRYVQMEPAYGAPNGQADTAGHLRGACAFGLIQIPLASQNDILFALVDLLNDPEHVAREAAARALSATGFTASAPLLRMKVLQGDSHSEVIGACFAGLMRSDDPRSHRFVAGFLEHDGLDLAIEAGLAMGESRAPEAIDLLIDAVPTATAELRHSLLMSLGVSRIERAVDYLVEIVRDGGPDAAVAIQAIAPSRFDQGVEERVRDAVNRSGSRELAQVFNDAFS